MHSQVSAAREERYHDRFIRETARRIRFLLAAAGRYSEPARFIEDLRRELACRAAAPRPDGS